MVAKSKVSKTKSKTTKPRKPTKTQIKNEAYKGWGVASNSKYPARFILTGFELGVQGHAPTVSALRMMSKRLNARLLFTPVNSHMKALEAQPGNVCRVPGVTKSEIVKEFKFNRTLKLYDARINIQQANPLTGLMDYGLQNESVIVGHSKMHMKMLATGTTTHPRQQRSTGVCTVPNYQSNRVGHKAEWTHKLGGLLIDILSADKFLIRELYLDDKGEIYTVAKLPGRKYPKVYRFNPNREKEQESFAAGQVNGDVHFGMADDLALQASYEMQWYLQSDIVMLHDVIDFNNPWSHHRIGRKSDHINAPSFYEDMIDVRDIFNGFVSQADDLGTEVVIVPSNHHEHLHRLLDSGRWFNMTGEDYKLALELTHKWHNLGIDPFKALLDEKEEKATWLNADNDFSIHGVKTGMHGHMGLKGSRGSATQLEKVFRNAVFGHAHEPMTYNDVMYVGTNSLLNMPYNHGQPNTSMHSNVIIFPNGKKQQAPIIKGVWY